MVELVCKTDFTDATILRGILRDIADTFPRAQLLQGSWGSACEPLPRKQWRKLLVQIRRPSRLSMTRTDRKA